mmetsp:Transcript_7960/g.20429  ORF Transcript_7960/g.20429 Transcript_7960/m.20429 type:complete len:208 (+) Transcript_7960:1316-1939(+)
MPNTSPSCPENLRSSLPKRTSHWRTVWSEEAEKSVPFTTTSARTASEWPLSTRSRSPVRASHCMMVLSRAAVSTCTRLPAPPSSAAAAAPPSAAPSPPRSCAREAREGEGEAEGEGSNGCGCSTRKQQSRSWFVCPLSTCTHWPSAMFHTRAVRSSDADTSSPSSADTSRPMQPDAWPASERTGAATSTAPTSTPPTIWPPASTASP